MPRSNIEAARCRSVSDLREYIADASDRQAVEKLLTHVNPVLGHLLMDYIELHAPLKQRLTVTKTVRLLLQGIQDGRLPPADKVFPAQLKIGESCGERVPQPCDALLAQ